MSLTLDLDTRPSDVKVKTSHDGKRLWVGRSVKTCFGDAEIDISLEDFCAMAIYVMTNTDLNENDPRLALQREIASLVISEGYNAGAKRLAWPEHPNDQVQRPGSPDA